MGDIYLHLTCSFNTSRYDWWPSVKWQTITEKTTTKYTHYYNASTDQPTTSSQPPQSQLQLSEYLVNCSSQRSPYIPLSRSTISPRFHPRSSSRTGRSVFWQVSPLHVLGRPSQSHGALWLDVVLESWVLRCTVARSLTLQHCQYFGPSQSLRCQV